jgi:hypothetical protein
VSYASDAPKRGVGGWGGCHGKCVLFGSVLIDAQKGKLTSVHIANVTFHHDSLLRFRDLSRAQTDRRRDEATLIGGSQTHNSA